MILFSRAQQYVHLTFVQAALGLRSLSRGEPGRRTATIMLTLWFFGLFGDALTTHLAISSGIGREANPGAAWIFEMVGVEAGVILTVLILFFLALPTFARPLHRVIVPLQVGLFVVLFIKLALTINNSMVIWGYPALTA